LAFCLQNVQSLRDFCGQIMPGYFCTIPKGHTAGRSIIHRTFFLLKAEHKTDILP